VENIQYLTISLVQLPVMSPNAHRRRGLSRALYEEFRARIADGTYAAGAPLPSSRALAAERGLSRGTVTLVYEQLAADGYIVTRPGATSRVASGAAASLRRVGNARQKRGEPGRPAGVAHTA